MVLVLELGGWELNASCVSRMQVRRRDISIDAALTEANVAR